MTTASPIFNRVKDKAMKSGLIAASILGMSLFLSVAPAVHSAYAADSDAASIEATDQSHFVRLGLNKSAVIKLPAAARDVIVGNPDIVDAIVRTKTTAYLFARKTGQTNIFFFDAEGQQILALDLEVAQDATALRKLLQRSLPGNRITVDVVENQYILGGIARNALEVKTAMDMANAMSGGSSEKNIVLNTMTVEGEDQVMLKVKIVEIQRNVIKQFGVDFAAMLDLGKVAFNVVNAPTSLANGLLAPSSGVKTGVAAGSMNFESIITAMEKDGLVRTLAEPNLTALTGQQAQFIAGGELPISVPCGDNSRLSCIDYKDYGVQVQFTPTVLSEDRIILKIATNVSEPTSGNAFSKRSTDTVLELPSGGSMMIAGLIKETTQQDIAGTPGLKNLPVLGQLFRSKDYQANETELVVFVTPMLVRPTSQSKLTSPDKGFAPPTDKQSIFMSRLNRVYGGNGDGPQGNYHGNVGFIVE